ncbi:uncharacterized protein B0T23DRAFT_438332 [Neurospora hispaniola]|uniref:Protein kinase domain-containing protein n=1 Tax=Neurospora hispaniola TaxID=588809 RepID=A0AAJ0ID35_9PEZI|nr:hypothetical protein B0T23DRAFT_438332 [Neurospora hispaniola]
MAYRPQKQGGRGLDRVEPPAADLYGERAVQREMLRYQQDNGYPCVLYRRGELHLRDTPEHRALRKRWKPPIPGPMWRNHFTNPFYGANQMYEIVPFSRRGMPPQNPVGAQAGAPGQNNPGNQAQAPGPQVGDRFKGGQPAHVQEAIARTRVFLETNSDFRIKKVLGWGGMGAVLLAELRQPREGQSQNVVIKMNLIDRSRDNFRQEKQNHIRVARAAHVVQCLVVEDRQQQDKDKNKIGPGINRNAPEAMKRKYAGDAADSAFQVAKRTRLTTGEEEKGPGGDRPIVAAPASGESPRAALRGPLARAIFDRAREAMHLKGASKRRSDGDHDINTHPDLMVIEPMWRGDFDLWVRKMAHSGEKFHSKVLWLIFECLFKGVLAMAHPPRHYHEYRETGGRTGPIMEERLPDREDVISFDKDNFIHFDLDLANILVGDFNVPTRESHSITPNIKIADLGLGTNMATEKNDFFKMWGSRFCGKPGAGWLSPEQFHPEWDYIKYTPSTTVNFTPTIAGNYTWKTNLYWIGQVMWCLVTLHKPSRMPFPYWITDHRPPGRRRSRAETQGRFWSWGGLVNHTRYNHIDEDLRAAIVLCMADSPAMRPEAKQLWDWIHEKTSSEWEGLSEDEARQWAARFFESPGVPGPARPAVFEQPGEDKAESSAKSSRPPWGKIPELAGVSPSKQSVSTFDFTFKVPGKWPKLQSTKPVKVKKKPAFPRPPKAAADTPNDDPQQAVPNPPDPAPQQAEEPPAKGPFGRPRRKSSGVKAEQIKAAVEAVEANPVPQEKAVPDPQGPDQEATVRPAAPVAPTPAAAAPPPRRPTPKERIQAALEATAAEPAPAPVIPQLSPPKAGTNAVAGRVRTFVVPSDSTAATSSTAAAAAAKVAAAIAQATSQARAAREGAPSSSPTNKRLTALGAGVRLLPHTKSGGIQGTPLQPNPPRKQVNFQTPPPIAADAGVPFLPRELGSARGKPQRLLNRGIIGHGAAAQGQRKPGGMYRPPLQHPNQPLQENRPPQQNWLPQQAQVPQQPPQQPPPQQPQQLKLPTAFILPNNQPGGSALPPQRPPGPPTPLVRRLNPTNRKVGGQYDLRARRKNTLLRGPGPSRLQQAWTPRDLAEGGKAGRAGSGLFAGLKLGRRAAAEPTAVPEAIIQEDPAGKEEEEGVRAGSGKSEQKLASSIPQSVSAVGRGPSSLVVGWEHLKEEPAAPLSPRELEKRRLEFERFQARNLLFNGSLLGVDWDDEDSSDSDLPMGSTGDEEEEDENQDAMAMSEASTTIGRFASFFFRFGGFGRGGSNS